MNNKLIWLIIISLSFFCQPLKAQIIGFELTDNRKKTEIPFELYSNLIVVPIIINEKIPLKFILDTGVRTTILAEKTVSDILNISYDRTISISGAGENNDVQAYVTSSVSLRLPGVQSKAQSILVLEEDYLQLRNYLGTAIHGILGYEIFSRFVVKINYLKKVITLYDPAHYKPQKSYTPIPITVEDTKPYAHTFVVVSGKEKVPAKLMIDTGASHAILLDIYSEKELRLPSKTIDSYLGRGLGGEINGKIGRIEKFELGRFGFSEVVVSFPDSGSYLRNSKPIARQGTLGGEVLSRFAVVFDYFNQKMYVKKNRDFKKSFEYNMSGITISAEGDDLKTFKVRDIRKDSPANKAGVMEGDIVTGINGKPADELTISDINSFFNIKENKRIRLSILRNKEKLKKKFKLERII